VNEDTSKKFPKKDIKKTNKLLTFLYCCGIIVPENERGSNEMT